MPRTLEELEQKIKRQEERLELLEGILLEGKSYQPGRAEFDRMIRATIDGDRKAMAEYIARGGEIFGEEEPYKRSVLRKRVERPGKPTNGCENPEGVNNRSGPASELRSPASWIHPLPDPVMLPAKERGAAFGQPKPTQDGYASP